MSIRNVLVGIAALCGVMALSITPTLAAGNSGSSISDAGFSTVLSAKTVGTNGATLKGVVGQSVATVNSKWRILFTGSSFTDKRKSNAEIFKITSSGLKKMNATVTNGEATVTFQNSPNFEVVKPTGSTVSKATSPVTGLPFAKTLGGGIEIALIRGTMILFSMRKKRTN